MWSGVRSAFGGKGKTGSGKGKDARKGGRGKGKDLPEVTVKWESGSGQAKKENTGNLSSKVYYGVVKSINSFNMSAFILCDEVMASYGADAFVVCLDGFKLGDHVAFDLGLTPKGQPQAYNVRDAEKAWLDELAGAAGAPGKQEPVASESWGADEWGSTDDAWSGHGTDDWASSSQAAPTASSASVHEEKDPEVEAFFAMAAVQARTEGISAAIAALDRETNERAAAKAAAEAAKAESFRQMARQEQEQVLASSIDSFRAAAMGLNVPDGPAIKKLRF